MDRPALRLRGHARRHGGRHRRVEDRDRREPGPLRPLALPGPAHDRALPDDDLRWREALRAGSRARPTRGSRKAVSLVRSLPRRPRRGGGPASAESSERCGLRLPLDPFLDPTTVRGGGCRSSTSAPTTGRRATPRSHMASKSSVPPRGAATSSTEGSEGGTSLEGWADRPTASTPSRWNSRAGATYRNRRARWVRPIGPVPNNRRSRSRSAPRSPASSRDV